jgi:hypothetical protein
MRKKWTEGKESKKKGNSGMKRERTKTVRRKRSGKKERRAKKKAK